MAKFTHFPYYQGMEKLPIGLYYKKYFVNRAQRAQLLDWLCTLKPLWEMRFSDNNPPPEGDNQRELLRPVYWLGNWQFACLNYYHPPEGIHFRCVEAEKYPPFLQQLVDKMEWIAKDQFHKNSIPKDWTLNTCLINFYGNKKENDQWVDRARVGEHKDFEPGPVASLSIGERAFFQFVRGKSHQEDNVVFSQWLEDSSLQLFSGTKWKEHLFHRVQRVEKKLNQKIGPEIENFQTRRINFTFRYVPREHIKPHKEFPSHLQNDIAPYVKELAKSSPFFSNLLKS